MSIGGCSSGVTADSGGSGHTYSDYDNAPVYPRDGYILSHITLGAGHTDGCGSGYSYAVIYYKSTSETTTIPTFSKKNGHSSVTYYFKRDLHLTDAQISDINYIHCYTGCATSCSSGSYGQGSAYVYAVAVPWLVE